LVDVDDDDEDDDSDRNRSCLILDIFSIFRLESKS
jgi:hypothetical protein